MIHLDFNTSKEVFIRELMSLAQDKKSVNVVVLSLPKFLASEIAIQILSYQLKTYPAEIYWYSPKPEILNLFKRSGIKVKKPNLVGDSFDSTQTTNSKNNLILLDGVKTKNNIRKSKLGLSASFTDNDFISSKELVLRPKLETQVARATSKNLYLPEANNKLKPNRNKRNTNRVGFASLLRKIENSKKTLIERQKPAKSSRWPKNILPSFQNFQNFNWQKTYKYLAFTASFVFVLGLLASLAIWQFPTTVYTVSVNPKEITSSASLSIDSQELKTRQNQLTIKQEVTNQTIQKVAASRTVTGEVVLVNPGNRGVNLNNGGFNLLYKNQKISVKANPRLSNTFFFSARLNSENSNLRFQVESENLDLEIPEGSRLEIVNLRGDAVCGRCYAQVTQTIVQTKEQTYTIFGNTDKTNLDQKLDTQTSLLLESEIQNLPEDWITSPDWLTIEEVSSIYSSEVGEESEVASLERDLRVVVSYMTIEDLKSILTRDNKKINKLLSARIETQRNENDKFYLQLDYTYLESNDLDLSEIESDLKEQGDYKQVQEEIQSQHKDVRVDIEEKKKGFYWLDSWGRVEVDFTDNRSDLS